MRRVSPQECYELFKGWKNDVIMGATMACTDDGPTTPAGCIMKIVSPEAVKQMADTVGLASEQRQEEGPPPKTEHKEDRNISDEAERTVYVKDDTLVVVRERPFEERLKQFMLLQDQFAELDAQITSCKLRGLVVSKALQCQWYDTFDQVDQLYGSFKVDGQGWSKQGKRWYFITRKSPYGCTAYKTWNETRMWYEDRMMNCTQTLAAHRAALKPVLDQMMKQINTTQYRHAANKYYSWIEQMKSWYSSKPEPSDDAAKWKAALERLEREEGERKEAAAKAAEAAARKEHADKLAPTLEKIRIKSLFDFHCCKCICSVCKMHHTRACLKSLCGYCRSLRDRNYRIGKKSDRHFLLKNALRDFFAGKEMAAKQAHHLMRRITETSINSLNELSMIRGNTLLTPTAPRQSVSRATLPPVPAPYPQSN